MQSAVLYSAHLPIFSTRSVRCARCMQGPSIRQFARQWLATSCSGRVFAHPSSLLRGPRSLLAGCFIYVCTTLLHPTHRLFEHMGFFMCTHCDVKFARCLADPCPVALGIQFRSFQQNAIRMNRLFAGVHPIAIINTLLATVWSGLMRLGLNRWT